MIDDIYLNPVYWGSVAALVVVSALLTRSRVLGFRFIILTLLAQYAAHTAITIGFGSPVTWFCWLSMVVFVVVSIPAVGRRIGGIAGGREGTRTALRPSPGFTGRFATVWFQLSRLFLLVYWGFRLGSYPFSVGTLDLEARLAAQQHDRVLFYLGLVTLPALASCAATWLRRGRRFTWVDLATLVLTVIGLVGSDSKATLLPLLLVLFGALESTGRRLREFRRFAIPVALLAVVAGVRLLLYFPTQGPLEVGRTMLYRLAANTDSVEYLIATRHSPGDFPFAGLPGLVPYISKLLGYRYDYSPGVWLYGQRYGDYTGFGPNSGPVLDYFGNIGWWGLLVPLIAALVLNVLRGRSAPQAVALASVVYLAFVDVTLLDLPLLFWTPIAVVVAAVTWRAPAPGWTDRRLVRVLAKAGRTIDSPLPVPSRGRARHRSTVPRAERAAAAERSS